MPRCGRRRRSRRRAHPRRPQPQTPQPTSQPTPQTTPQPTPQRTSQPTPQTTVQACRAACPEPTQLSTSSPSSSSEWAPASVLDAMWTVRPTSKSFVGSTTTMWRTAQRPRARRRCAPTPRRPGALFRPRRLARGRSLRRVPRPLCLRAGISVRTTMAQSASRAAGTPSPKLPRGSEPQLAHSLRPAAHPGHGHVFVSSSNYVCCFGSDGLCE